MFFSSIEGLNLAILGKNGDFERDQNQKFIFLLQFFRYFDRD